MIHFSHAGKNVMINHEVLAEASKAKRMATMFRGVQTAIPVQHNGQTVIVQSSEIAQACERCKNELIEDFVSGLTSDEVISQAYRIVNIQRRTPRKR
jgi:hypothetical protein